MLNIIPDDNFIVDQSPKHKKNQIKEEETINQFGDSLSVFKRKNSLKLQKKTSMILTKVSLDRLDVYDPLYLS